MLASDLGAWALGFVFAPSPRRLAPAAARALLRRAAALTTRADFPLTVGVFVDASPAEIAGVVAEVGLDCVQLHSLNSAGGDEVRTALSECGLPASVIQAVPVAPGLTDEGALRATVAAARRHADIVLLDTAAAGKFGGTGESFPWSLARAAADGGPLLLAGGIGPDNVAAALCESGAWGVDVSSRVERAPGVKDDAGLRRLFTNACATGMGWSWPGARPGRTAGPGAPLSPDAASDASGTD